MKKELNSDSTTNANINIDEYDWQSLQMPRWISASEKSQIEERLPKFVEKLLGVLHLTPQNQLDELFALKYVPNHTFGKFILSFWHFAYLGNPWKPFALIQILKIANWTLIGSVRMTNPK